MRIKGIAMKYLLVNAIDPDEAIDVVVGVLKLNVDLDSLLEMRDLVV